MAERHPLLRHPLYLLVVLALLVAAAWGFWPRALPVEIAAIVRGPVSAGFTEEGRTRLRERYVLSAPVDGFLQRIALEPGDTVAAGAEVAVMQPANSSLFDPASRAVAETRWRAARDEEAAARAMVLAATAAQALSQAQRERGESLFAAKLIARSELDALLAQARADTAQLRAAQARARAASIEREGARAVLDLQGARPGNGARLVLRAPVSGQVTQRHLESEGVVRAGQALLEVGDLRDLEVMVEALTSDALAVAAGTPVELQQWGGPGALRGHVRLVEPGAFTKVSALGVEEQRVRVLVDIDDPPPARRGLGDAFRVDARFITWQQPAVLRVPTAALFRDGPHWAVYAVEDGRARLRRVRLGHFGEQAAQLLDGLAENERVILYPGDKVRDGARVSASD